jgi:competence protein ComEC
VASHTDEDHLGGLVQVFRTLPVEQLVIPSWMVTEEAAVPMLRVANSNGARVIPVARGSVVRLGGSALEVIWPPALEAPAAENERSLVARLNLDRGSVLITSDVGRMTEGRLRALSSLKCDVLLVPHHGSRSSTSPALLEAAQPAVALIPAGHRNNHKHPHPEVLQRLRTRQIPFRYPARDGWCGAEWSDGSWRAYP